MSLLHRRRPSGTAPGAETGNEGPFASPTQPRRRLGERRPLAWTRRVWAASTRLGTTDAFAAARPELDEIFAEQPPRFVRHTHYVLAAVVLTLLVIASVVQIDIVVSAPGKLVADAPTIVLQPMQLSIIRDLRVKAGDAVRKGDILAALDPTFTQADRTTLLAQRDAVRAEIERIEAELDGTPLVLATATPDAVLQRKLHQQRQSQFQSQIRAFDADEQRFQGNIATADANVRSLDLQYEIYTELEEMYEKLYKKSVSSRVTFLGSSVSRSKAARDKDEGESRLNEARNLLASRQAERQVFVDKWRSDLMDGLIKARREEKGITENLVKANLLNDLVALVAPEDGIVLDVARRSVGSVMQAAEPLVTLLPSHAELVADIQINSSDVGYMKAGDEAAIKVDAFPYQRHGIVAGRLRSIGMDSSASGLGGSGAHVPTGVTHRGQIALTATQLRALPSGTRLIPGMTLTADIKVGSRSIISYFVYPLMRGFDESIREP